ncbi:MAG: GTPase Era [Nitrospirales bacterium]|nr:GTPase Era [Nitrospira sp.]MDR4502611.1 GTPase Era [Nitrospirales bacterium]
MKFGTLVLVGRPNVGKSTLLNTLVRQKVAIVSDKPQTTRTRILGVGHLPQAQIVILDTPGLHKPKHQLNRKMVRTTLDSLPEADVIYAMVDARKPPGPGDRFVLEQVTAATQARGYNGIFLLLNKVDEMGKARLLPLIDQYRQLGEWTEIVPISAKQGDNIDRLIQLTLACLPDEPQPLYEEDFLTDQSMRHMAAEIVREKILQQTHAELPYAVAVLIEDFLEKDSAAHITASIYVEKSSQKPIIIGKQGQRLKAIGTDARIEMEQIFGVKIFLELWVKVREDWRDNERLLTELGY